MAPRPAIREKDESVCRAEIQMDHHHHHHHHHYHQPPPPPPP
jgi:hypothetical protein